MFAYLKSLFGGRIAHAATPQSSVALVAPRRGFQPSFPQVARPRPVPPKPQPASPPPPTPQAPPAEGQELNVSLQAVLNAFPTELADRILRRDVRGATLTISVQRAISQLPQGVVTISYGELRQAAPQLFAPGGEYDSLQVNLPLNEIIAQINPALIGRPATQKPAEVPQVSSPFEELTPRATQPPAAPNLPLSGASNAADSTPASDHVSSLADERSTPIPAAWAEVLQMPTEPVRTPLPQSAKPADDTAFFVTSLGSLIQGWPEALRTEIANGNLAESKVELPVGTVQEGLKRGKVILPWKMIRSWVKPMPQPVASAYENAALELPLEVLAPLFISRQKKASKPQQKVAVDEAVPNLFSGPPRSDSALAEAVAGNTALAVQQEDTSAKPFSGGRTFAGGTEVLLKASPALCETQPPEPAPAAYVTTPKDIVARAAALDGVAGALVALPDGLVVASKLSPGLNEELLAAFLPQFFGRLSRGAKELGMGVVNDLNFTVDNVPWRISRMDSVFFAAFGRLNQALPASELAALAARLDHRH